LTGCDRNIEEELGQFLSVKGISPKIWRAYCRKRYKGGKGAELVGGE
jgi:hypothetical protein